MKAFAEQSWPVRRLTLVTAANFAVQVVLLFFFPLRAACHWGADGLANGWMNRYFYLLYFALPFAIRWLPVFTQAGWAALSAPASGCWRCWPPGYPSTRCCWCRPLSPRKGRLPGSAAWYTRWRRPWGRRSCCWRRPAPSAGYGQSYTPETPGGGLFTGPPPVCFRHFARKSRREFGKATKTAAERAGQMRFS